MPLSMYRAQDGVGEFSKDSSYDNPVVFETTPDGGVLEYKVYLRMEDALNTYLSDGRIFAVDTDQGNEIDEASYFGFASDESGGPGEYGSDFEFIIPLGSQVPVWIRVSVPQALETEPKVDVKIAATYIEHSE